METSETAARPKVAMLVGNNVSIDTRVKRTAASAAAAGFDVRVYGVVPAAKPLPGGFVGGAEVVRPFVKTPLRSAHEVPKLLSKHLALELNIIKNGARAKRRVRVADTTHRYLKRIDELRGRGNPRIPTYLFKLRRAIWRRWMRVVAIRERVAFDMEKLAKKIPNRWWAPMRWRRRMPIFQDYELVIGPLLDEYQPDVIYAHDVHLLPVAARAKSRALSEGRKCTLIYDVHEFVPGQDRTRKELAPLLTQMEDEFVGDADALVTVSPQLATLLEDRFRRPVDAVVLNAYLPVAGAPHPPSLRETSGVGPYDRIIVYSGGTTRARGIDLVLDVLPTLPADIHLVLVTRRNLVVDELEEQAERLGVSDRFHLVPFVDPAQVAEFLAEADVGLCPLRSGYINNEVALANKLFEYAYAGVPVVVSDLPAQGPFIREHGYGEVFDIDDRDDLRRAIMAVLEDRDGYVAAITPEVLEVCSWERQAEVLVDLLDRCVGSPAGAHKTMPIASVEERPSRLLGLPATRNAKVKVAIGPHNRAGQAVGFAEALEVSGLARTRVVAVDRKAPGRYPADVVLTNAEWSGPEWRYGGAERLLGWATHMLIEEAMSLIGGAQDRHLDTMLQTLADRGISPAFVFHGPALRLPAVHAGLEIDSMFSTMTGDELEAASARLRVVREVVTASGAPVFVSSPELLRYAPEAEWAPYAVDLDRWHVEAPLLERAVPIVLHSSGEPHRTRSDIVDEAMERLAADGLIEYSRHGWLGGAAFHKLLSESDIVIDGLGTGDYSVEAVQAMAAGRVVVGHVADDVRSRFAATVPVVEATGEDLEDVVRGIVADREPYVVAAKAGVAFAADHHDGGRTVAALEAWATA